MRELSLFALVTFLALAVTEYEVLHCASDQTTIIATVNGKPIEETALRERIKAIHRYKPMIRPQGGAGTIRISDLLLQMIDEALILEEAYRVALDKDPDFRKRLESYITRQAVIRLRKEEVLDKIDISEEDVLDYFKEHYEKDGRVPAGQFEKTKQRIKKKLFKQKEKELSDNFVAMLREQANIWIDSKRFDLVDPRKKYDPEVSVVASVNGQPILMEELVYDMKRALQQNLNNRSGLETDSEKIKTREELKRQTLDGLITYRLVEKEALGRDYIKEPTFKGIITRRKEALLIKEFRERIIYPLAIPTKKELTIYYQEHINDFRRDSEVWFTEMVFQAREDAYGALAELKEGANFEYLATQISERWTPKRGRVWVNASRLSPVTRKQLNRLEVGQISEVFADSRHFKIVKLKGRRRGQPEEFSRVAGKLNKIVGHQKFENVISDYLGKVRKGSEIKIDERAVTKIEEEYRTGLAE